jgi:drug/metabolite transporter, DME family
LPARLSAAAAPERRRFLAGVPPICFVLIAALLWSTGGMLIKATSLTALELSFVRSLFAAGTVALFTRRAGFGINAVTGVASVAYAVMLLTFVTATKMTTAANAIFLQYTAPIYILFLEPILHREKMRTRDMVMVAVCVAGMALFFVGKLRPQDVSGNLAALLSGLCFGVFTLLLRHPEAQKVNRASSVIYGNLLLAAATAPFFFMGKGLTMTAQDALIASYLGILQIGVPYLLFTLAISRGVRSLDAGIVGYIEPVLNPLWVFLAIGERPHQWALIGGAVIIAAVLVHTVWNARGAAAARAAEAAAVPLS